MTMVTKNLRVHILFALVMLPVMVSVGWAQAADNDDQLLYGTWELDTLLSVYIEGEEPRKKTRIYTPHPLGVQARIITIDKEGIRTESGYTGKADGVPHPTYGLDGTDEIIFTQVGPYTAEVTLTHAGLEVGKAERIISLDGKEMTVEVVINGNLLWREVYQKVAQADESVSE